MLGIEDHETFGIDIEDQFQGSEIGLPRVDALQTSPQVSTSGVFFQRSETCRYHDNTRNKRQDHGKEPAWHISATA